MGNQFPEKLMKVEPWKLFFCEIDTTVFLLMACRVKEAQHSLLVFQLSISS